MGMTNKQFQGIISLILMQVDNVLKVVKDNTELQELRDVLQSMLEDGDWQYNQITKT